MFLRFCKIIDFVILSLSFKGHYMFRHARHIELQLQGLQCTTNAAIRRWTADDQLESCKPVKSTGMQRAPWDSK